MIKNDEKWKTLCIAKSVESTACSEKAFVSPLGIFKLAGMGPIKD